MFLFRSQNIKSYLFAFFIGIASALIAFIIKMPLPWIIGPMVGCALLNSLGIARLQCSFKLKKITTLVLGVLLGSRFTSDFFHLNIDWFLSSCAVLIYVVLTTSIIQFLYRRIGKYDQATAYFAAAPGGLSEMVLAGSYAGADERIIAFNHALRIFIIVLILSFGFRIFGGYHPPVGITIFNTIDLSIKDWFILISCGFIGWFIAWKFNIPSGNLICPLLCSAFVHIIGLTQSYPPTILIIFAQIIVGISIGCRFHKEEKINLYHHFVLALIAIGILLFFSLTFAYILSVLNVQKFSTAFLAFSPAGLTEMSLIALTLGMDSTFIVFFHLIRIFCVVIGVPLFFQKYLHKKN
ncbi:MAG: AbrB family transcriptional regulator [Alphaproteobacteria bacterium]|nr:AbrB family transcriptional regulator [Alphaproteobacteria bacterium]